MTTPEEVFGPAVREGQQPRVYRFQPGAEMDPAVREWLAALPRREIPSWWEPTGGFHELDPLFAPGGET